MRRPPVRSYIHIAPPSARASFLLISPSDVNTGSRNGQHAHEVRGVAAQDLALGERFVDEPDLLLLEVAEAAVDELRRLRRRARREVVALDERGAQTAAGGVERAADAGDAATDDDDVERFGREAPDPFGAIEAHDVEVTRPVTWPGPRPGRRTTPALPSSRTTGRPSSRQATIPPARFAALKPHCRS